MNRMKLRIAVATCMALSATSARAEWMNGNELHDMCSSTGAMDRALCLSYVIGVLDGTRYLDQPLKTPIGATGGQVRDVVARYLANHPDSRTLPARKLVKTAIIEAWPELQAKPKSRKR